jgi:membrane-bound lytic murein transglycosylase MltF
MRGYFCHLGLAGALLVGACGSPGDGAGEAADEYGRAFDSTAVADTVLELLAWGSEAAQRLRLDETRTTDLDSLAQRRAVRVLVPFSRTYYFLDGGVQRGITYDAFREFEKFLNEELGTRGVRPVHVILIPTARDHLLTGLVEGRGDIAAAGLTITPERQAIVDFSEPFSTELREVVVTGPAALPLESLEDLAGREIWVRLSSSYYESLAGLNASFESAGKAPMTLNAADEHLEDEDLLEMVNAGLIPMIIVDEHKAELWAEVFDAITVRSDLAVREGGRLAWAFRKNSPQLAEVVNRFVSRNKRGSYLFNVLWKRYWGDAEWVRNATDESEMERFRAVMDLFQRYAGEYGFPYLLMMAQGYQESRLDQTVQSRAGAVGIMQLLPSTAADPNVGIPDISNPENNVHAGVRYMEFLRRHYFFDESIDEFDRMAFAIAAYNAGPNRIQRLRGVAAERGLDPDVWFRNVELIVAEKVGRETISYVDNIYKYYAAYGLIAAEEEAKAKARQEAEAEREAEGGNGGPEGF